MSGRSLISENRLGTELWLETYRASGVFIVVVPGASGQPLIVIDDLKLLLACLSGHILIAGLFLAGGILGCHDLEGLSWPARTR
jgi:hypothetical protein